MTAYRGMLRISWKDHRTNQSILEELDTDWCTTAEWHTAKKTPVLRACGASTQYLHLHPSRPYCRHKETWKRTKTLDARHQRLDRTTSSWVRENCTGQNSMACKGVAGFGLWPSGMRKNHSSPIP